MIKDELYEDYVMIRKKSGTNQVRLWYDHGNTETLLEFETFIVKLLKLFEKEIKIKLEKLLELKQKGVISEEEFNMGKKKILEG